MCAYIFKFAHTQCMGACAFMHSAKGPASMFPTARQAALTDLLVKWDAKHPQEMKADMIMMNPLAAVRHAIDQQFTLSASTSLGLVDGTMASSSSMVLANMPKVEKPRSLKEWWAGALTSEATDAEEDSCGGLATIVKKSLMAALNLYFANLAIAQYTDDQSDLQHLCLKAPQQDKVKAGSVASKTREKEVFDLVRHAAGQSRMNYWGRIIDDKTARTVAKSQILPIKLQVGRYPEHLNPNVADSMLLYLDGSSVSNTKRSDCCVAWLVKAVPEKKDSTELELQRQNETSPIKRAKLDVKIEQFKAKQVDATHAIAYTDFEVTAKNVDNEDVVYYFSRPILVNSLGGANIFNTKCMRERIPWDDEEFSKRDKSIKAATSFVLQ